MRLPMHPAPPRTTPTGRSVGRAAAAKQKKRARPQQLFVRIHVQLPPRLTDNSMRRSPPKNPAQAGTKGRNTQYRQEARRYPATSIFREIPEAAPEKIPHRRRAKSSIRLPETRAKPARRMPGPRARSEGSDALDRESSQRR